MSDFEQLLEWCNKRHIIITLSAGVDSFCSETLEITIKSNNDKIKVYALLHEIGHYLQFVNSPHLSSRLSDLDKRTNVYKVFLLEEELNAWIRGLKLAHRLNIFIDEKKYWQYASRCLMSYVRWATK